MQFLSQPEKKNQLSCGKSVLPFFVFAKLSWRSSTVQQIHILTGNIFLSLGGKASRRVRQILTAECKGDVSTIRV